jgi:hypothetical protein
MQAGSPPHCTTTVDAISLWSTTNGRAVHCTPSYIFCSPALLLPTPSQLIWVGMVRFLFDEDTHKINPHVQHHNI